MSDIALYVNLGITALNFIVAIVLGTKMHKYTSTCCGGKGCSLESLVVMKDTKNEPDK